MSRLSPLDRDAIEAVLLKAGLLRSEESIPDPFSVIAGSQEEVYSCFFILGAKTLVLAKVARSENRIRALWSEVEEFRKAGAHPALLPVSGNTAGDGVLVYNDGRWIDDTFRRLKLLRPSQSAGAPRRVFSGLAGFSRVYLFHIPTGIDASPARNFLVKFDRPDRMQIEWTAIENQRKAGDVPPEIQFPLHNNRSTDGIMVTPVFQGKTTHGLAIQLDEFLGHQLISNRRNVHKVVKLLDRFLAKLYIQSSSHYEALTWEAFNPELTSGPQAIIASLQRQSISIDASTEEIRLELNAEAAPIFKNPLYKLEWLLKQDTGRVLKARIHGDLQSTNILVSLTPEYAPDELGIIDIEKLANDGSVLEDAVRIEADFWRSVFTEIARKEFTAERMITDAILAITIAMDTLDGRPVRVRKASASVLQLANAAGYYVSALRKIAWARLRAQSDAKYMPTQYMAALRFYLLKSILKPLVYNDALRCNVAVVGAALAAETFGNIVEGRYPKQFRFLRRWSDNTSPKKKVPKITSLRRHLGR